MYVYNKFMYFLCLIHINKKFRNISLSHNARCWEIYYIISCLQSIGLRPLLATATTSNAAYKLNNNNNKDNRNNNKALAQYMPEQRAPHGSPLRRVIPFTWPNTVFDSSSRFIVLLPTHSLVRTCSPSLSLCLSFSLSLSVYLAISFTFT